MSLDPETTRDAALLAGWVVSSAALFTVHVFILARALFAGAPPTATVESKRRTRLLVLATVVLPPLAPWLAARTAQRRAALAWIVLALAYGLLWLSSRAR